MAEPSDPIGVRLIEGPLSGPEPVVAPGAGAVVTFAGVVRELEAGRPLAALVYEAYEPMTSRELGRLATRLCDAHGLVALEVTHSVGRVPVGEVSFRLTVAAPHRREALVAVTEFIDVMKREIPLWKVPEWR